MEPGAAHPASRIWSPNMTFQLGRSLAGLAAAVFLGIWLGSRVLTPFLSGPVLTDDETLTMQDSYAQEISLQDETVERLESYFFDNTNSRNE